MKRVALIGPSGAGKSECIKALGYSPDAAEMDRGLDTSIPHSATEMLDWILNAKTPVVGVSVHRDGLEEMALLKESSVDPRIPQIYFVYLHASKLNIEKRFEVQLERESYNIKEALNRYDEVDNILRRLADCIIKTENLTSDEVAQVIEDIMSIAADDRF